MFDDARKRWWALYVLCSGVLMIVLNYLGLLPKAPSSAYLLGGLGLIAAGFILSTRWH